MRSKYAEGVSGPFHTGLAQSKKIKPRRNSANVDISPQADNVIVQLRGAGGPQNLSARFTQYGDIVGSFFAPKGQVQNQVLGRALDFEGSLIRLSWVLPATHGKLTEVQNSSLGWL